MNEFQVALFCLVRAFGLSFQDSVQLVRALGIESQEDMNFFASEVFQAHLRSDIGGPGYFSHYCVNHLTNHEVGQ